MKVIAAVLVGALLLAAGPAKRTYDSPTSAPRRWSTSARRNLREALVGVPQPRKAQASQGHWSTTAGAR
jgi:hypothetical protein